MTLAGSRKRQNHSIPSEKEFLNVFLFVLCVPAQAIWKRSCPLMVWRNCKSAKTFQLQKPMLTRAWAFNWNRRLKTMEIMEHYGFYHLCSSKFNQRKASLWWCPFQATSKANGCGSSWPSVGFALRLNCFSSKLDLHNRQQMRRLVSQTVQHPLFVWR